VLPGVKQVVPVGLFGKVGVITKLRTTVGVGHATLDAVATVFTAVADALTIVVLPLRGLLDQPVTGANDQLTGMVLIPFAPVSDKVAVPGFAIQVLKNDNPVKFLFTLKTVVTAPQPTPVLALLTTKVTLPTPPSTFTVVAVPVVVLRVQFGLSTLQV
jgi:hypothetical protein